MDTVKIGAVVQANLPQIIDFCETRDRDEIIKLSDPDYSHEQLGLGWAFFKTPSGVTQDDQHTRYWVDVHRVLDHEVRVTSQWRRKQLPHFLRYLADKGLEPEGVPPEVVASELSALAQPPVKAKSAAPGGPRYKNYAIGNAQNSVVRFILGNLGHAAFSEKDWIAVKEEFDFRCAYCGDTRQLVMDHAVPISITSLGEHHLGNLVPACRTCNSSSHKGQKRYDDHLASLADPAEARTRLVVIEEHMAKHGYVPLTSQLTGAAADEVRRLLQKARTEVASIAQDTVARINDAVVHQSSEHGRQA